MKIQFFKQSSLGMMVAIVPLVGGCNQQTDTQGLVAVAFAEPAIQAAADSNAAPAPAVSEASPAPAGKAEAVPAALDDKPLPPSIKATGPVAEVIKLAQAGVDEGVMLTFITNSTSTFGLGSDEIIYLNDIGVPNNVVTTMIEHDQATKQFWANAAQAQAAAAAPAPAPENQADQTAAAPSYVDPPQAAPAELQPAIVNNNYFYDTLSPYGSWVNVDGYGLCWQPTVVVVNRGWQPYGDRGHWVYTDSGWYWISDYSWGATTFHYGRWFSHPRWGWCWWPDRVWAPSWVTWRSGGDYCGWAPLPPFAYYQPGFGFSFHGRSVGFSFDFGISASCYTFVPFSRFCDPHPYRHRFPSHQVTQVFNKTTIINNFGAGRRNTVINHGIAPDRITAVTRQEIRKVAIRDAGPAFAKGSRRERLDSDGRTLTVHRPNIPEGRLDPRRTASATTVNPAKGSPYAPLQTTRSENKRDDVRSGKARSSFEENRSAPATASKSPGENRTAAPAAPTTLGSRPSPTPRSIQTPSAKSDLQADRSPKVDDNQRGKSRGSDRSSTVPPSVVRGSDVASPSSPANATTPKDTTPNSSLVVIGKRDAAPPQRRGPSVTPTPQTRVAELEPRDTQVRTPTREPAAPRSVDRSTPTRNQFSQPTTPNTPQPSAPASTYSRSPGASSQSIPRQEIPRATRSTEDRSFSRPSYSAPAPVQRQTAPSYSPPVSAPAPAPRYSAPPSAPAPRYDRSPPSSYQPSAPAAAPRSAPAPSYSPPASPPPSAAPAQRAQPSPPSQSDSGRGPKGRNQ